MKAVIIAAGKGKRLIKLTKYKPKCLIKFNGKTILENTLSHLRSLNIQEIAVVVGYKAEKFHNKNLTYFKNNNYETNNILHSLMCAKDFLKNDDFIICYSDIWFEQIPFQNILNIKNNLTISVDIDWKNYYIKRSAHPISEAELVVFNDKNITLKIGKDITMQNDSKHQVGEFMGLLKISRNFIKEFVLIFEKIDQTLNLDESFHRADRWENAYLTDFLQELINRNYEINCNINKGGWAEIDTFQDYNNFIN